MKSSQAPPIDDFVSELLGDLGDEAQELHNDTNGPVDETSANPSANEPEPEAIPESKTEPEPLPDKAIITPEPAPAAEAPAVDAPVPESEEIAAAVVQQAQPALATNPVPTDTEAPFDLEEWLQPASHPAEEQFHAPLLRCVSFKLQDQFYAAEVDSLLEVMPRADIVQIPSKGYPVLGILNLRGNIVTVIDPAALLGLNPSEDRESRLIVVDYEFEPVALRVDEVLEVVSIDETQLQTAPESAKHVRGLIESSNDMLTLLDLKKLVAKAFK
ncbi:MAG: chemotaxis protein CheW [Salinisphaeraceae bacterium]|nr:chemotaxis protein CheW [Salinisphaeraceae bacterium]